MEDKLKPEERRRLEALACAIRLHNPIGNMHVSPGTVIESAQKFDEFLQGKRGQGTAGTS